MTWGSDSITYTPDPGTSGESLQYTIGDGNGGSDTANLTITLVTVTDYTLEWQQPDGSWLVVPDGELSWSHDALRWTAQYSPSTPPMPSTTEWFRKGWADVNNPQAFWESFALATGDDPAIGNPGAGEWAIRPSLHFDMVGPQTAFTAVLPIPKQKVVAEITSVQWVPHVEEDGSPSALAGELSDDPDDLGKRFFPDAGSPNDPARDRVDLLVTVTPALGGIPIVQRPHDVDDPSDLDGPIDDDAVGIGTDHNAYDNSPPGLSISYTVSGSTDANGQFRSTVTMTETQPGSNWRFAVAGRFQDLDFARPLKASAVGHLWHDTNVDGWRDQGEPLIDEGQPAGGVAASEMLTIWRYLHVELDSMGAPPPGTPQVGPPIDVNQGDIPAPDTALLEAAFASAFIQVVAGTPYDSGDVPFVYHVVDAAPADRGSGESAAYWAVYVIEAYEGDPGFDGDPVSEDPWFAFTFIEHSFVYHEVIRDAHEDGGYPNWAGVYTRQHMEQQAVVHEIGHQFGLYQGTHPAPGYSIMSVPQHNPIVSIPRDTFSEDEIKFIRQVEHP